MLKNVIFIAVLVMQSWFIKCLHYECSEFKILVMHELDSFNVAEQNI